MKIQDRIKTLYALYNNDKYGETIRGIRGLPFESDKTFLLEEWQKRWFPEGGKV